MESAKCVVDATGESSDITHDNDTLSIIVKIIKTERFLSER